MIGVFNKDFGMDAVLTQILGNIVTAKGLQVCDVELLSCRE